MFTSPSNSPFNAAVSANISAVTTALPESVYATVTDTGAPASGVTESTVTDGTPQTSPAAIAATMQIEIFISRSSSYLMASAGQANRRPSAAR